MMAENLVTVRHYNEVPPRADYALTERGRGLLDVLDALYDWSCDDDQ